MKKILCILLIFTACSAYKQSVGKPSDKNVNNEPPENNINKIVNDIRNNPIDLSVKKYNLIPFNIKKMELLTAIPVLKGNPRNAKAYGNQLLMIQYFDNDWYSINKFIFQKRGMSLDNGIVIGDSYTKIKSLNIPFGEYDDIPRNCKLLFSGDSYDFIYNFNDTILVFDGNDTLIEIHINFAKINIDRDISKLLINEWKTYPTDYPQWKLLFSEDNTFSFTWKTDSDDEYTKSDGIWRLFIYDNDIPEVELIFNDNNRKHLNSKAKINKTNEDYYRIDFGGWIYFYPYPYDYP